MTIHPVFAVLLGALLLSANASAQDIVRDIITDKYIIKSGINVPCDVDCKPSIAITRTSNDCFANAPATVTIGGKGRRNITWMIDKTTIPDAALGTATYEFHAQNGILLIKDKDSQVTGHGHLGSVSDRTDTSRFTFWHANGHAGGRRIEDAVYLPIVLQRVIAPGTNEEKLTLCGATDPRIVNN